MRSRKVLLGLGLLGGLLTVTSVIWNAMALTILGAVFAACAAVLQYLDVGGAVVVPFTVESWVADDDDEGYHVDIASRRHGKRRPVVSVFARDGDGDFDEVMCDVRRLVDGSVRVKVSTPIAQPGEVRIS